MRISISLAILCSQLILSAAADDAALKSKEGSVPMLGQMRVGRVLCLGNSITHHGPSEKVHWSGNWGMAASCAENDYVHVLARGIAEKAGAKPNVVAKNIAAFEREYATYDVRGKLREEIDFRPDVLVLAIAENVPALKTPEDQEAFRKALRDLLAAFTETHKPVLLVRSSFWPNKVKDTILREVCAEFSGTFVDISALSKDERNSARSERDYQHAGVAAHPGDRGMKAIADALLAAMVAR